MIALFVILLVTVAWQCSVALRLRASLVYKAAGRRQLIVSAVTVAAMLLYIIPLPLAPAANGILHFWVVMIGAFCLVWGSLIAANIFSSVYYERGWMDERNRVLAGMLLLPIGLVMIEPKMRQARKKANAAPAKPLIESINELFDQQKEQWPLAKQNFDSLARVSYRTIDMGTYRVAVQCNPARKVSTTAKIDPASIAERPCFLCADNRPAEQQIIPWHDYDILVNPYPIFDPHLTIPARKHTPQQLGPHLGDMLALSKELPGWAVFYNGPKCGASAPDHFHFQAVKADRLPLVDDYQQLEKTEIMPGLYRMEDYGREVLCFEAVEPKLLAEALDTLYDKMHWDQDDDTEPMMNLICIRQPDRWLFFVMPRSQYRPWQYTAQEPDRHIMISPGTIEMAGVMIAPRQEDYDRLTADDIRDIYKQVSYHVDFV